MDPPAAMRRLLCSTGIFWNVGVGTGTGIIGAGRHWMLALALALALHAGACI